MTNPKSNWNGWFGSSGEDEVATRMANLLAKRIDELVLYEEFVKQDFDLAEKFEQYKTFVLMRDT